ncbi:MAG: hypothetical protein RR436_05415 [Clostridia bacterium]
MNRKIKAESTRAEFDFEFNFDGYEQTSNFHKNRYAIPKPTKSQNSKTKCKNSKVCKK